jgi:hypothetical protein
MTPPGESPRTPRPQIGLTVPLERASTFSPRRARSAVAAWLLFLVSIVAVGVVGRLPDGEPVSNPAAKAEGTRVAGVERSPAVPLVSPTTMSSRPTMLLRAASTPRHTFGEDGLVGGIVFGDNVPSLSQADIERDGYRFYQELSARASGVP